MSDIPGWTGRKSSHRRGKPVGAETDQSGDDFSEKEEVKKNDDDTFIALFYDKKEADAFKKGQNVEDARGDKGIEIESVEWSTDDSKAKRDDLGNLLTRRGNIVKRGFNVA
mmetsp:Transcript_18082/g.24211  ORF Transcript_18082/g.24211 Transcript_18082/m.24211 type:complete len:111 (+) Transcript_18082:830-1162(+)